MVLLSYLGRLTGLGRVMCCFVAPEPKGNCSGFLSRFVQESGILAQLILDHQV